MAEVGSILIVGGNIAGYTRVMTTTIALETDKGNFELALALGIILLLISFGVKRHPSLRPEKGIGRGMKLTLSHITKKYGDRTVLSDCS